MYKFDMLKPLGLILTALIIAVFTVYISTQRALTSLENVLLQFLILFFGIVGSYLFGQQSAKDAAKEIIKPHARSAFRRLMSLYQSLSRAGVVIENSRNSEMNNDIALAKLETIIIEQVITVDDALEDWYDIVPEDVEELRRRLKNS